MGTFKCRGGEGLVGESGRVGVGMIGRAGMLSCNTSKLAYFQREIPYISYFRCGQRDGGLHREFLLFMFTPYQNGGEVAPIFRRKLGGFFKNFEVKKEGI